MFSKDVNLKSPVRLLESSIHGGLGPGNLGVVMARAGVGKTAFLVQVALDDVMRDRDVIHFALAQRLEHVQDWYEALFNDLADYTGLEDRETVRAAAMSHHVIQAYAEHKLSPEQMEKSITLYGQHTGLKPKAILVDGFDWVAANTKETLAGFKAIAKKLGAELWISAQVHRSQTPPHPTAIPPPCDGVGELIDVAVFLEPHDNHATVRILKDHDSKEASSTHLELACDTLRLVTEGEDRPAAVKLPPSAYTLLSGGAQGAEAAFGELAEKYHLHEVAFTFEERTTDIRRRGAVVLGESDLKQGHVSHAYLQAQMHRTYPNTPQFQKTLDTIWHQVNTASEVFVIGTVLPDNTVKGGTGWAAELAKHTEKALYVYCQERRQWLTWKDKAWVEAAAPVITKTRFCGTGTRFLSDDGKRAISELFERSFGDSR
jgi:hypothetical protein